MEKNYIHKVVNYLKQPKLRGFLDEQIKTGGQLRDDSFGTYAKFSKKLTFSNPLVPGGHGKVTEL